MTIKSELEDLTENGILQPEDVVKWAREHIKSELHQSLEWDDSVAGHQYRLWQVRRLIKVHIVNEYHEPQMISLTIDRPNPGGGYRLISDVIASPTYREIAMKDALNELRRIRAKYGYLTELAKIWDAIHQHDPEGVS